MMVRLRQASEAILSIGTTAGGGGGDGGGGEGGSGGQRVPPTSDGLAASLSMMKLSGGGGDGDGGGGEGGVTQIPGFAHVVLNG